MISADIERLLKPLEYVCDMITLSEIEFSESDEFTPVQPNLGTVPAAGQRRGKRQVQGLKS